MQGDKNRTIDKCGSKHSLLHVPAKDTGFGFQTIGKAPKGAVVRLHIQVCKAQVRKNERLNHSKDNVLRSKFATKMSSGEL